MPHYNFVNSRQFAWFLFILILGVSGCVSAQENVASTPAESLLTSTAIREDLVEGNEVTSVDTAVPMLTPSPILVTTAPPTSTPNQPTRTPSTTYTPVSPTGTLTVTPTPTLSVEQEGTLLSSFLTGNGGCDLPCWWGVTPGETSEQEAQDMFASQGISDWVRTFGPPTYVTTGLGYPRPDDSNRSHDIIVRFWAENDLIYFIDVDGGYRREDLRSTFVRDWQSYSPAAMLSRYGMPPYIEFVEVRNSPYYRLILSYDRLGIEIVYIVPFESLDNGNKKICFVLENIDFISLALYPPEQTSNAPIDIIPNRLDSYTSWESRTGLGTATFQQLFNDTSNPPCVVVN